MRLCNLSDPLLHVSDNCNTSTTEAEIEDYVMHISDISLVILSCYSFFLNMCSWWL